MCTPHFQVVRAMSLAPVPSPDLVDTFTTHRLINQYPDVYIRTIFKFFDDYLYPDGFIVLAALLDCHGLIPEMYHQSDPVHYYRCQARPRFRKLLEQFLSDETREIFQPTQDLIVLPQHLREIFPPETVLTFDLVYFGLIRAVGEFGNWIYLDPDTRTDFPATFELDEIYRIRFYFYLIFFAEFRKEVDNLKELVTPGPENRLGAPQIQLIIGQQMETASQKFSFFSPSPSDLVIGVLEWLFRMFSTSNRFNTANNNNRTRLEAQLLVYLKMIGAYEGNWKDEIDGEVVDWWPLVEEGDEMEPEGYDAIASNLFGGTPVIGDFLARTTIIPPNATNGQLVEFLVDSMIEYAANPGLSDGRIAGTFDQLDPIMLRSQIIWLSLIQFPMNVPRVHRSNLPSRLVRLELD